MQPLQGVTVRMLPREKWEQNGGPLHAEGRAMVSAPVLNALAIGECSRHGMQTRKVRA